MRLTVAASGTPLWASDGHLGNSFAPFDGPWPRLGDPWLPLGAYWELVNVFCVLLGGSSRHHSWLFAHLWDSYAPWNTLLALIISSTFRLYSSVAPKFYFCVPTSCTNPEEKEYIDQQDYSIKLISPFNPTEKEYIDQQCYSIKQTSFTSLRDKGVYRQTRLFY